MKFYRVRCKQGKQFFDGEWSPYPSDLMDLYGDASQPVPDGLHVQVVRGTQPGDILFATCNVVSDRFVGILEEIGATGFRTFRVPLIKRRITVATYNGLKILGRGGPFDAIRSNAKIDEFGSVNGYSGIYMDESRWDGCDVFFIPGLSVSLYVTERVAHALQDARLLNVRLVENSECHMPLRR